MRTAVMEWSRITHHAGAWWDHETDIALFLGEDEQTQTVACRSRYYGDDLTARDTILADLVQRAERWTGHAGQWTHLSTESTKCGLSCSCPVTRTVLQWEA